MSAALGICVKKRFYMALCLQMPNSKNTKQHNLQVCYLNKKKNTACYTSPTEVIQLKRMDVLQMQVCCFLPHRWHHNRYLTANHNKLCKGKGKAIPLQAWTGPEGSRRLRPPDFKTIGTWRWQGCQLYAPAAFTPRKHTWYSFLLEAESTPGP